MTRRDIWVCTLLIVTTQIGCTWWFADRVAADLASIIRAIEQLQR